MGDHQTLSIYDLLGYHVTFFIQFFDMLPLIYGDIYKIKWGYHSFLNQRKDIKWWSWSLVNSVNMVQPTKFEGQGFIGKQGASYLCEAQWTLN